MAALEVVKSRLDSVGMGDFCLELHSRHSNKKEVLNELQKTLNTNKSIPHIYKEKYEEMDRIKTELNDYNYSIHKPFGRMKLSPFELFGLKEEAILHFENKNKELPYIPIEDPLSYSPIDWETANNKIEDVSELLKELQPLSEHPWRYCNPETIIPTEQNEIKRILEIFPPLINSIQYNIKKLAEKTGIEIPQNIEELEESFSNALMISESPTIEPEILRNTEWDSISEKTKDIIDNIEEYHKHSTFLNKFQVNILDNDLETILKNMNELSEKTLKIFNGNYRKTKKTIKSFYLLDDNIGNDEIIKDLSELIVCKDLRKVIRDFDPTARFFLVLHGLKKTLMHNQLKNFQIGF